MDMPPVLARSHRPVRRAAAALGLILTALAMALVPAGPVAAALLDTEVVDALEVDGRLIEIGSDGDLEAAVERANAAGIAFAWLDRSGDDGTAVSLADTAVEELSARGSRYHTVLVFLGNSFAASSLTRSQVDLDDALDAALPGFADGDMGRGVDDFTSILTASGSSDTTLPPSGGGSTDGGGGPGFGTILLVVAALGGGFLLVRRMVRGRRAKEQAEIDLAEDRAEIEEQLKNNADRVIALGDRVIARGDRELIVLYEEASATYQDVSQRIDEAENAAEIDELDDRIDHAEWQFKVIEAELDGSPRPRPPTPDDVLTGDPDGGSVDDRRPTGQDGGDAAASDRSARRLPPPPERPSTRGAPRDVVTSPRTGRTYPRSSGQTRNRRRGGGGLGGALGGGLGGVLADIVLGGGLGGLGGSSRRTTQRRTSSRGGGLGGGGLGGGVLRRSGSSNRTRSTSRPRSRSRSRSSGGRSVGGNSRSRGGRRL